MTLYEYAYWPLEYLCPQLKILQYQIMKGNQYIEQEGWLEREMVVVWWRNMIKRWIKWTTHWRTWHTPFILKGDFGVYITWYVHITIYYNIINYFLHIIYIYIYIYNRNCIYTCIYISNVTVDCQAQTSDYLTHQHCIPYYGDTELKFLKGNNKYVLLV